MDNNMDNKIITKEELAPGQMVPDSYSSHTALVLIDHEDNEIYTYIDEDVGDEYNNPIIMGRQRWLVDVVDNTSFGGGNVTHRTHRDILFEIGPYRQRIYQTVEDDCGEVTSAGVTVYENIDTNADDFNNVIDMMISPLIDKFIEVDGKEIY